MRDVSEFLDAYRSAICDALGASCRGIYVVGSLPRGAFDPGRSDIDLVVLVGEPVGGVAEGRIQSAHRALLRNHPLARRMAGCFVWHEENDWLSVWFHGGRLGWRRRNGLGAVMRRELHRHATVLFGVEPGDVFPEATRGQLEAEMKCNLFEYWLPKVRWEWGRFFFDEGVDFAVLTLPRILYTLETGELITKPQAAAWIERRFPHWRELVADVRSRFGDAQPAPRTLSRVRRAWATRRFVLEMIEASYELTWQRQRQATQWRATSRTR